MKDENTFREYQRSSQFHSQAPSSSFPDGRVLSQAHQARYQRSTIRPQPARKQRPAAVRMPKARALALLEKMKRGIVIASFLSFGAFSALAMSHTWATTTQQAATTAVTQKTTAATATVTATKKTTAATATVTATPTATTATATPTATTTTQQGGGYGFGSSNSASTAVSGTHTS